MLHDLSLFYVVGKFLYDSSSGHKEISSDIQSNIPVISMLWCWNSMLKNFYTFQNMNAGEEYSRDFQIFTNFLLKHFYSNLMLSFWNERGINNDVSRVRIECSLRATLVSFTIEWKYVTRLYKLGRKIQLNS